MDCETREFYQGETRVVATVQSNLCYCDDTGAWRDTVLLATQGGRKTTASRIGKRDGRLWNIPYPDGLEIARFHSDDTPAIFVVPNEERNLNNCVRLKLYRRSLMKHCNGVTFDLTKNKDLICALPYATVGMDASWSFLFAFQDAQGQLHWFASKESFKLGKNDKGATRKRDSTSSSRRAPTRKSTRQATQPSSYEPHALPMVKSEPLSCVMPDNYAPSYSQPAPTPTADIFPNMFVTLVAAPTVRASVIAVNQGNALIEMMDGTGTRQCHVSELAPIATIATQPQQLSHQHNLNALNTDSVFDAHDTDLVLSPSAQTFDAMDMFADAMDHMTYGDNHMTYGDNHVTHGDHPMTYGDSAVAPSQPSTDLFAFEHMDLSLGVDSFNSAVPSFFDEQYA